MTAPPPKPDFESDDEIPDPDEDDLDDLDDMLDEFSATTLGGAVAAAADVATDATANSATAGVINTSGEKAAKYGGGEEEISEEEFAKQLKDGMASLLSGMGTDSKEVQEQFEEIFKQITTEAVAGAAESNASSTPPNPPTSSRPSTSRSDVDFQATIRKTIERMQTSGDQATKAAAADGSDDILSELLKQMGSGGPGGGFPGLDGANGEEDFSKMLMGMMEQLTNKEILYEPMKDLDKAFPGWMEANKGKISEEDKKRYELQQTVVREIVAKFEEPTFNDDKPEDRQYIVERMQKMQDAGSPPPDLVGDMPSAQEAFGAPGEEDCNPQ